MSWNQCDVFGCDNEGTRVVGRGTDERGEYEIRRCSFGSTDEALAAGIDEHEFYKTYCAAMGWEYIESEVAARMMADEWLA